MKTALPTLFFLFAFITITQTSNASEFITTAQTSNASEFLLDIHRNPIQPGVPYYFLSIFGNGGLEIAGTVNEPCSLFVVQVDDKTEGMPLRISRSRRGPIGPIKNEELVNIRFDGVIPSRWEVEEGSAKVEFINESPLPTLHEKFKFKESHGIGRGIYGYNILYCPKSDSNSNDACKYLKLVTDENNHKRLVLGDVNPSYVNLHVLFKKKETCTGPEISMI